MALILTLFVYFFPWFNQWPGIILFNWDSLHARLNSHYEAWSYKKNKHKKIKAYRKSVQKEPTVKRCLLILDWRKATNTIGQRKAFYRQRIPYSSCAKKETVDIETLVTSRNGDRTIMQSIWTTSRPPSRIRKQTSCASSDKHLLR